MEIKKFIKISLDIFVEIPRGYLPRMTVPSGRWTRLSSRGRSGMERRSSRLHCQPADMIDSSHTAGSARNLQFTQTSLKPRSHRIRRRNAMQDNANGRWRSSVDIRRDLRWLPVSHLSPYKLCLIIRTNPVGTANFGLPGISNHNDKYVVELWIGHSLVNRHSIV